MSVSTIDKFGRRPHKSEERAMRGLPGIGFKLTSDGNHDIDGKVLTNVATPRNYGDVTTKTYVDNKVRELAHRFVDILNRDFVQKMMRIIREETGKDISEDIQKMVHNHTASGRAKCLQAFQNLERDIKELKARMREILSAKQR